MDDVHPEELRCESEEEARVERLSAGVLSLNPTIR